jgi:hypothetical protein
MIAYRLRKETKTKLATEGKIFFIFKYLIGECYPHVFIPRKTVRNGMELWTFATFVPHPSKPDSKMPYFVEIVPHLQPNDGGGKEVVRKMMYQ